MKQVTLHEITIAEVCYAEALYGEYTLNFEQLVQASGQEAAWVLQLFEHDILSSTAPPQRHQFVGYELARVRKAYRLQRDFDASLPAVAVMLDLLQKIQDLRKRLP